jgi:hypothetical protein
MRRKRDVLRKWYIFFIRPFVFVFFCILMFLILLVFIREVATFHILDIMAHCLVDDSI